MGRWPVHRFGVRQPFVWLKASPPAYWVGSLVFECALLAIWFATTPSHRVATTTERAFIAVLPFANVGGDPAQDYLGEGMSAEIIASLSKFAQLLVVAETSSSRYKTNTTEPSAIGREIGVRYLVRGSVKRDGDRLRIITQLLEASTGAQIWAQQYDRELAAVFSVQDDVTQNIVGSLAAHVSRTELDRVMRKPAGSFAAYEYILQGRSLLNKIYGADRGQTLATARTLFEICLELDPNYAPALHGLAAACPRFEPTAAFRFGSPLKNAMQSGEHSIEVWDY